MKTVKRMPPNTDILPPKVKIVEIPKKGRGVVILENTKKNTVVEIAPIIMLEENDQDMVSYTIFNRYLFQIGDSVNSAMALGYAALYNHSSKPNCEYTLNDKVIKVYAIRDIKKGEELTIDYGWDKKYLKDFI